MLGCVRTYLLLAHDSGRGTISMTMSTTEIIEQIKTLPLEQRKAVLRILSEELEEEMDTRLFDERSNEPDGRTLAQVLPANKKKKP